VQKRHESANPISYKLARLSTVEAVKEEKINILFVCTTLVMGGCEKQLYNIILRMNRRRFNPIICCLKDEGVLGRDLRKKGIKAYSNLLRSKYDIRVLFHLVSLIKREKIHAIFTVGEGDKMFWGRLAGKFSGVPVIVSSVHSTLADGEKGSTIGFLNKLIMPISDKIVAVSEDQKEFLVKHEGLREEKITVIPNGVDLSRFHGSNQTLSTREELGIPLSHFVVGIIAMLRPEKAHSVFIHAASRILRHTSEVTFLVVGEGDLRAELEELVRRLGVSDNVRFLGERQDVEEILASLDAVVLCSYTIESFPNSILEAMAAGKPVVVTDLGGLREIVVDGETGFVVKPRDVEGLADKVLWLINNPEKSRSLGEAGMERVGKLFPLEKAIRAREKLIEDLFFEKNQSRPLIH